MREWMKRVEGIGLLAVLALALTGCPQPTPVPFDASGQYAGTWEIPAGEKIACDLQMELFQLPELPWVSHMIAGTVTFSWDCVLPQEILDMFDIELPDITVPVLGEMANDNSGQITLGLSLDLNDIPEELLVFLPQDMSLDDVPLKELELSLEGVGVAGDGTGTMAGFDGNFSLHAAIDTGDAKEIRTIDLAGVFTVDRTGDVEK